MSKHTVRKSAIDTIAKVKPAGGAVDYLETDVRDVYSCNVFTDTIQRERLPKDIYKKLQATINSGKGLDSAIADSVAVAMRDWAIEGGATHYCHWFQPMTGSTAEKHDSFIEPDGGGVVMKFSGKDLVRGEPDASSFPSGGLRATFEARGYTAWDPSSSAFLLEGPNGVTLVIPTMFISWTGEALGAKTPLLRSDAAISNATLRLLKLFGNNEATRIASSLGAEQEYFLVDKHFALHRPDLTNCGRTLFGAKPPKGQELDDNYFGAIEERVIACMAEMEYELIKIGVPIKTRHNEVAPGQFELAPTFEASNIAADHQMITMEILRRVSDRHGFVCLFHEKPFAGVNGSGKHVNWSIGADVGGNLLNPGDNPHDNAQFIAILAACCRAVHNYAPLLRITAASAGNDHRLGANEAPPAIISIYLGAQLTDVLDTIESGKKSKAGKTKPLELGVSMLPKLPRDAGDRNRTSPFAFTGNKFEFRAVGSNQNPSAAITVINTIVAESIDYLCDELVKAAKTKTPTEAQLNKALQKVLPKIVKDFRPVIFNGDGYTQEWKDEAAKRGLPNLPTTPEALDYINKKDIVALFKKYGVFSKKELDSRKEIHLENYASILKIEADTTLVMARTMLLPAALKYQTQVAEAYISLKAAGIDSETQANILGDLAGTIDAFIASIDTLAAAIAHDAPAAAMKHACYMRDTVLAAMNECRELGDALETVCNDELWPIPSYNEMLFIR